MGKLFLWIAYHCFILNTVLAFLVTLRYGAMYRRAKNSYTAYLAAVFGGLGVGRLMVLWSTFGRTAGQGFDPDAVIKWQIAILAETLTMLPLALYLLNITSGEMLHRRVLKAGGALIANVRSRKKL